MYFSAAFIGSFILEYWSFRDIIFGPLINSGVYRALSSVFPTPLWDASSPVLTFSLAQSPVFIFARVLSSKLQLCQIPKPSDPGPKLTTPQNRARPPPCSISRLIELSSVVAQFRKLSSVGPLLLLSLLASSWSLSRAKSCLLNIFHPLSFVFRPPVASVQAVLISCLNKCS